MLGHFPLNRTQNHSADLARSSRSDQTVRTALTGGGRTLQIPVFSAMGRILLINAKGSANSSQVGSNTGHSGGGVNSAGPRWVISQVRFRSEAGQKRVAQRNGDKTSWDLQHGLSVCYPPVRLTWTTRTINTHIHTHRDVTALRLRAHPLKNLDTKHTCPLTSSGV